MRQGAAINVYSSRAVAVLVLAIGVICLALAALWEPLRTPYALAVFVVAALVGAWMLFDPRVRLTISDEGIRYADWGPALVPWREFSGYVWTSWRHNPYLQLIPRRPSQLVERFSRVGRFNHHLGRLVGIPSFSIAVTPLEISERELTAHVAQYLTSVLDNQINTFSA